MPTNSDKIKRCTLASVVVQCAIEPHPLFNIPRKREFNSWERSGVMCFKVYNCANQTGIITPSNFVIIRVYCKRWRKSLTTGAFLRNDLIFYFSNEIPVCRCDLLLSLFKGRNLLGHFSHNFNYSGYRHFEIIFFPNRSCFHLLFILSDRVI